MNTTVQSQNIVYAYFTSKQIRHRPTGFAVWYFAYNIRGVHRPIIFHTDANKNIMYIKDTTTITSIVMGVEGGTAYFS